MEGEELGAGVITWKKGVGNMEGEELGAGVGLTMPPGGRGLEVGMVMKIGGGVVMSIGDGVGLPNGMGVGLGAIVGVAKPTKKLVVSSSRKLPP